MKSTLLAFSALLFTSGAFAQSMTCNIDGQSQSIAVPAKGQYQNLSLTSNGFRCDATVSNGMDPNAEANGLAISMNFFTPDGTEISNSGHSGGTLDLIYTGTVQGRPAASGCRCVVQ